MDPLKFIDEAGVIPLRAFQTVFFNSLANGPDKQYIVFTRGTTYDPEPWKHYVCVL